MARRAGRNIRDLLGEGSGRLGKLGRRAPAVVARRRDPGTAHGRFRRPPRGGCGSSPQGMRAALGGRRFGVMRALRHLFPRALIESRRSDPRGVAGRDRARRGPGVGRVGAGRRRRRRRSRCRCSPAGARRCSCSCAVIALGYAGYARGRDVGGSLQAWIVLNVALYSVAAHCERARAIAGAVIVAAFVLPSRSPPRRGRARRRPSPASGCSSAASGCSGAGCASAGRRTDGPRGARRRPRGRPRARGRARRSPTSARGSPARCTTSSRTA